MELLSLNEVKLIIPLQRMNNFDEIINFFMNKYQNKIGISVKLMTKVLMEIEELKRFQGSTLHTVAQV